MLGWIVLRACIATKPTVPYLRSRTHLRLSGQNESREYSLRYDYDPYRKTYTFATPPRRSNKTNKARLIPLPAANGIPRSGYTRLVYYSKEELHMLYPICGTLPDSPECAARELLTLKNRPLLEIVGEDCAPVPHSLDSVNYAFFSYEGMHFGIKLKATTVTNKFSCHVWSSNPHKILSFSDWDVSIQGSPTIDGRTHSTTDVMMKKCTIDATRIKNDIRRPYIYMSNVNMLMEYNIATVFSTLSNINSFEFNMDFDEVTGKMYIAVASTAQTQFYVTELREEIAQMNTMYEWSVSTGTLVPINGSRTVLQFSTPESVGTCTGGSYSIAAHDGILILNKAGGGDLRYTRADDFSCTEFDHFNQTEPRIRDLNDDWEVDLGYAPDAIVEAALVDIPNINDGFETMRNYTPPEPFFTNTHPGETCSQACFNFAHDGTAMKALDGTGDCVTHAVERNATYAFTGGPLHDSMVTLVSPSITGILPDERAYHSAVVSGEYMVVFGGIHGVTHRNDVHTLHLTTGVWTIPSIVNTPPPVRSGHSAVSWVDASGTPMMTIFGGVFGAYSYLNDTYTLNLHNWTWNEVSTSVTPPSARANHSAVSWVDVSGTPMMTIFGGAHVVLSGPQYKDKIKTLNLTSGEWGPTVVGPSARAGHSAVVWGESMIVFGGRNITHINNDVYVINLIDGTWTIQNDEQRPSKRLDHSAVVVGDSMIVFGGYPPEIESGGQMKNDVHTLNLATGVWTTQNACPNGLESHSAVAWREYMIVFGGRSGGNIETNEVHIFWSYMWPNPHPVDFEYLKNKTRPTPSSGLSYVVRNGLVHSSFDVIAADTSVVPTKLWTTGTATTEFATHWSSGTAVALAVNGQIECVADVNDDIDCTTHHSIGGWNRTDTWTEHSNIMSIQLNHHYLYVLEPDKVHVIDTITHNSTTQTLTVDGFYVDDMFLYAWNSTNITRYDHDWKHETIFSRPSGLVTFTDDYVYVWNATHIKRKFLGYYLTPNGNDTALTLGWDVPSGDSALCICADGDYIDVHSWKTMFSDSSFYSKIKQIEYVAPLVYTVSNWIYFQTQVETAMVNAGIPLNVVYWHPYDLTMERTLANRPYSDFIMPHLILHNVNATANVNLIAEIKLALIEWMEPASGTPPSVRAGHTAVAYGDSMIVFSGAGINGGIDDNHIYTIKDNIWNNPITTGEPPSARLGHSAVVWHDSMIVFGGTNGSYFNDVHAFDIQNYVWGKRVTTNAPSERHSHSAVMYGDKMVIFGGYDGSFLNDVHILNLPDNVWSAGTTSGAPSARTGHSAVAYGGNMIIFGGGGTVGTTYNDVHSYDIVGDAWTGPITASLAPSARSGHSAVLIGGTTMRIFGGANTTGSCLNDFHDMNTIHWTWSQPLITGAPSVRSSHSAVVLNDVMLIFGGGNMLTNTNTPLFNDITAIFPDITFPALASLVNALLGPDDILIGVDPLYGLLTVPNAVTTTCPVEFRWRNKTEGEMPRLHSVRFNDNDTEHPIYGDCTGTCAAYGEECVSNRDVTDLDLDVYDDIYQLKAATFDTDVRRGTFGYEQARDALYGFENGAQCGINRHDKFNDGVNHRFCCCGRGDTTYNCAGEPEKGNRTLFEEFPETKCGGSRTLHPTRITPTPTCQNYYIQTKGNARERTLCRLEAMCTAMINCGGFNVNGNITDNNFTFYGGVTDETFTDATSTCHCDISRGGACARSVIKPPTPSPTPYATIPALDPAEVSALRGAYVTTPTPPPTRDTQHTPTNALTSSPTSAPTPHPTLPKIKELEFEIIMIAMTIAFVGLLCIGCICCVHRRRVILVLCRGLCPVCLRGICCVFPGNICCCCCPHLIPRYCRLR